MPVPFLTGVLPRLAVPRAWPWILDAHGFEKEMAAAHPRRKMRACRAPPQFNSQFASVTGLSYPGSGRAFHHSIFLAHENVNTGRRRHFKSGLFLEEHNEI